MKRFGKSTILSNITTKYIAENHLVLMGRGQGEKELFSGVFIYLNNTLIVLITMSVVVLTPSPGTRGRRDRGAEKGSWRMHVFYYFTRVVNQNINSKCYCKGGRGKPG